MTRRKFLYTPLALLQLPAVGCVATSASRSKLPDRHVEILIEGPSTITREMVKQMAGMIDELVRDGNLPNAEPFRTAAQRALDLG